MPGFLAVPHTHAEWNQIAAHFEEKFNFPHCLGAIDGKHVVMQAPARNGSECYNYKKTHSSILLVVYNANYEYNLLDIGDAGRESEGGVYKNSNLGYAVDHNILKIPPPAPINDSSKVYPYVFVADDAFQLTPFLLKPFSRRDADVNRKIFNYRLSRARRLIENCFGITAAMFRIYRRSIIAKVDNIIAITKAVT